MLYSEENLWGALVVTQIEIGRISIRRKGCVIVDQTFRFAAFFRKSKQMKSVKIIFFFKLEKIRGISRKMVKIKCFVCLSKVSGAFHHISNLSTEKDLKTRPENVQNIGKITHQKYESFKKKSFIFVRDQIMFIKSRSLWGISCSKFLLIRLTKELEYRTHAKKFCGRYSRAAPIQE